ncbi:MAG: pyridoxamine 5'-phosphate oxidase family protein [Thermoguttaceae bacterium]|nr:pyridoxamine 5'-phosphate oxidase family protein [Thermoguttaceae bacterium]
MFRPMRRNGQELEKAEALDVLKNARRGVLSVTGDDGWPYGIWLNPLFENGKIYFHCAKAGHKIDAIRKDPRASFTVIDEGVRETGGWDYTFRSVVVFGRVEFLEDHDESIEICRRLARRFNPSDADIEDEIRRAGPRVQVIALVPEHITGKRVHER